MSTNDNAAERAAERYMSQVEGDGAAPAEQVTSLGKARLMQEDNEPESVPFGYIEIHADAFPSKGLFYPEGTRFFIRPAPVAQVRHFSTIDPRDQVATAEGLNDIIKSSVIVRCQGKMMSYRDILDDDRRHVILAVKEATFVKGENRLVVECKCESCKKQYPIEIRNSTWVQHEIDPAIMRYYDEGTKSLMIRTKDFGVIKLVPPTIGVATEVTKHAKKLISEGKEIDASLVKMLPYLLGDWRTADSRRITGVEVEIQAWDMAKFQFMNALVDMLQPRDRSEVLRDECPSCGAPGEVPVTFPDGPRALFIVSGLHSQLA